jgi:hypothetical protein
VEVIDRFSLPPDSVGSARALSRFGYSLQEALSDLIDNSVDAAASRVHIVFHRSMTRLERVTIADNGRGMSDAKLRSAMQFAANVSHQDTDLGYYGVGMKSSSLSQCRSMTVISAADEGHFSACRWTTESIAGDWQCEALSAATAQPYFIEAFTGSDISNTGTVVLWEDLEKLRTASAERAVAEYVAEMQSRLLLYLGLVYHRFIAAGSLRITIAVRDISSTLCFPRIATALDPFKYSATGAEDYPKIYKAHLADGTTLNLEGHIWPSHAASAEYLLGKRSARTNQGFYFYRNNRLIQAGGWNNVVRDQEADLSQARVAVSLDGHLAPTNIQKSAVELPESLSQSISAAVAADGESFMDYLSAVRKVASKSNRRPALATAVTLTLGRGIPHRLRSRARQGIRTEYVKEIDFSWQDLEDDVLFAVDRLDGRVVLNKRYRTQVLHGVRGGGADAPLLKTALFLLLEDELDRLRSSVKSDVWLAKCNRLLLAALREEIS